MKASPKSNVKRFLVTKLLLGLVNRVGLTSEDDEFRPSIKHSNTHVYAFRTYCCIVLRSYFYAVPRVSKLRIIVNTLVYNENTNHTVQNSRQSVRIGISYWYI